MLNNILSMEGVAVLDKKQQMSINGGSCAYYNGVTGSVNYNLSPGEAQGSLSNASDHWCCSSCDTASWYSPGSGSGCSGGYQASNYHGGGIWTYKACEHIE